MASSTVNDSGSALAVPVGMPRRYGLSVIPDTPEDPDGSDEPDRGELDPGAPIGDAGDV
jgi:hypothetical protein